MERRCLFLSQDSCHNLHCPLSIFLLLLPSPSFASTSSISQPFSPRSQLWPCSENSSVMLTVELDSWQKGSHKYSSRSFTFFRVADLRYKQVIFLLMLFVSHSITTTCNLPTKSLLLYSVLQTPFSLEKGKKKRWVGQNIPSCHLCVFLFLIYLSRILGLLSLHVATHWFCEVHLHRIVRKPIRTGFGPDTFLWYYRNGLSWVTL